ncbi:hypothetical protein PHYBLDRAFT_171948 [Phycomyces blakesleeanus NRRL 1555(-)]|uniref:Uncharacterized protein n=1 Tax=Phycomyces blakesleeanus (strain ATCC 8743b / DSM 1359 / FGSC 10004 / NBRC 33097 / NRRL 1555) TaxID=763407 RepID=A0A167L9U4_PHYB8|nr:hypothetical protein PHYBLDRAFT_171948 [Phycomyces blakesleeanus NRRL 1555(-)]OAD69925.1 hypothetical protein PHYBLDRAFT_171948 [Phycomyces blakesleeanus NRRL 1555(-)]|eukprot:XP_018287965.1 hypothetical protein PHYBLDRAFT_171948 [Phycomyces blakesleeanus NRRL 1555(-)]
MSCLNQNKLNNFQFAQLILSVSQITDLYLGPLFLIIYQLLFSTDRQIIFYRQYLCIFCLSTLLFSELPVNKQAKKACHSKQSNTVGVDCTRGEPMDIQKE